MHVRLLWLLVVTWVAMATGCAKRGETASSYDYDAESDDSYGRSEATIAKEAKRSRPSAPASAMAMPSMMDAEEAAPEPPPADNAGAPQQARMVHYAGYARLRVVRVDAAIDAIGKLATDVGGFVERVGPSSVVVRVPVAAFEERFNAVLAQGDVLDRSLTAQDLTEAFQAVELRLKTARATRDRLVELLARSQDEKEKLALLREIQRLEQEVDQLEGQGRTLSALASMSRINVDLVPREALAWQGGQAETLELAWIRGLSPLRLAPPTEARRLKLAVPDGMVQLESSGPFVAESADGARIWSHRLENAPRGDATWWQTALRDRLAPEFAVGEAGVQGAWMTVRLVDRGDEPYTWVIAVRVNGDHLDLVQIYYPSAAAEQRYAAAVAAVLVGVGA
jgi:Domain of unknown function (DUF4349)